MPPKVDNTPAPQRELAWLEADYSVPSSVLEDLCARLRADARDAELVNLRAQPDRGGFDRERASRLIAELPWQ
jgi:hypothetical protein